MKRLLCTSLVLLASVSGPAMAVCTAQTRVTGNALTTLISGNTVCATRGADRWQEQHRGGGALWDYKLGPDHPVDPSKPVGTWAIQANNVTYSYTGGPSYTYSVHEEGGGRYSFCTGVGGAEVVSGATFRAGSTNCP